jgi:UDP-glucuronate decarboxylase
MTGARSELVQQPLPADDPKQRRPDISVAKEVLGWEPAIQLDQGLEHTVEYFRRMQSN